MKIRLFIVSVIMAMALGAAAGLVLAQSTQRLLNAPWVSICSNAGTPLVDGGNCNYLDAISSNPGGSHLWFLKRWFIFPEAVANPPKPAIKIEYKLLVKGFSDSEGMDCTMKTSHLVRDDTGDTLWTDTRTVSKYTFTQITSVVLGSAEHPIQKIQVSVYPGEGANGCTSIAVDEVYIYATDLDPTPTPTASPTETSTPPTPPTQVCVTVTSPAPQPTSCYPTHDESDIVWSGSQHFYNVAPFTNLSINAIVWTSSSRFDRVTTDDTFCNTQVKPSDGTNQINPAPGDIVSYVILYCASAGSGRNETISEIYHTREIPAGCTTPAPTPTPYNLCYPPTDTPTPTNTPTISPTLPITIQQTLTALPPTVFGTATPNKTTTAHATQSANATLTATAAGNGATQTANAQRATATHIAIATPVSANIPPAPTAPKICSNYSWYCYQPGTSRYPECIYTTLVGVFDENCQGEFGFANVACPVGYIPPDDKCGITPTPGPTGTPPPLGACYGPSNGAFVSSDYWSFRNNAVYDTASQSAYLPENESGDNSVAPRIANEGADFTIPTAAPNKFVLFTYDARAEGCGDAGVQAMVTFNGNNDVLLNNPHVIPNWLNFQFDVSSKGGQSVTFLSFGNFNINQAVIIDNVCFKQSDLPPDDPTQVQVPPCIDLGVGIGGCEVVNQILYGYGYDVRAWEATYNAGVAVFSPSTWVPWLASALWVNAAKPLACFMLEIYSSVIAYLQSWINELINYAFYFWQSSKAFSDWLNSVYVEYGNWGKASAEGVGSDWLYWWAGQYRPWLDFTANTSRNWSNWLRDSINGPLYQWLKFPAEVTSPWLLWLATALFDMLSIPYALLSDFFTVSIVWIDEGLKWLVAKLLADSQAIQAESWNFGIDTLNQFINSYNDSSLSGSNSTWLQGFIDTWNVYLYPFLLGFIQTQNAFSAVPMILAAQFLEFIRTSFLTFVTFMSWLWQMVVTFALIPLEFFAGFQDGMNNPPYGNIIECSNDNFWCAFFAGFQVINRSVAAAYAYPIVLITIIIGTIVIIWNAIISIASIDIK